MIEMTSKRRKQLNVRIDANQLERFEGISKQEGFESIAKWAEHLMLARAGEFEQAVESGDYITDRYGRIFLDADHPEE